MMSGLGRGLFGVGLALAAVTASAQVELGISASPGAQPRIVGTETADRFVVAWKTGASVEARPLEAGVPGEAARLFQESLGFRSRSRYQDPALTFKSGQDRVLAAALRVDESLIGADPIWVPAGQSIELAVFDRDLGRLGRRWVDAPSGTPFAEGKPALAADDFGDAACCALLAYENASTRGLELERLDATAARFGSPLSIAASGSALLVNPTLEYQHRRDIFLLVYETANDIRARVVPAVSGAPLVERIIATKARTVRSDTRGTSRPSVAYGPSLDRFLVAWRDDDQVFGLFLSGLTGAPVTAPFLIHGGVTCSGFPAPICVFDAVSVDNPSVAAVEGGAAFLVSVDRRATLAPGDPAAVATFRVTSPVTPTFPWDYRIDFADGPSGQTAVAFDAESGQAVVAYLAHGGAWAVRFVP
jgi:hypothetical protein